jgi:molybdopterin-synthase adenylyltransferase
MRVESKKKNTNNLPYQPKLSSSYYSIPMSKNEIQLRNAERIILLEGDSINDFFPKIVSLLDGNFTVPQIIDKLSNTVPRDEVLEILDHLNRFKLLEDGSIKIPEEFTREELIMYKDQLNLFSHFTETKYEVQRTLKRSKVGIIGLGQLGFQIAKLLAHSGIGYLFGIDHRKVTEKNVLIMSTFSEKNKYIAEVLKKDCLGINPYLHFESKTKSFNSINEIIPLLEGLDLVIVAQEEINPRLYEWVNEACINLGINWTSCESRGLKGFIGPTVIPKQTACYKCFEIRLNSNLQFYREALAFQNYIISHKEYREYGELIMFIGLISNIMAMDVIKMLTNFMPPITLSRQILFDYYTMKSEFHEILRLPRCPSCGIQSRNIPSVRPWM